MAFIRSYSEQGDPGPSSMRAGMLRRRPVRIPLHLQARGRKSKARMIYARPVSRLAGVGGDPFRFKLPKFVRKLSLKKVVSAVGKVAKVALPIAAPFIPGIGPMLAPILGAAFAGGGSPESPAPELVQQPEPVGTVGEAARSVFTPDYLPPAPRYGYQQQAYESPEDGGEDEEEYGGDEDEGDYYEEE